MEMGSWQTRSIERKKWTWKLGVEATNGACISAEHTKDLDFEGCA